MPAHDRLEGPLRNVSRSGGEMSEQLAIAQAADRPGLEQDAQIANKGLVGWGTIHCDGLAGDDELVY
jgi:hypothetical protein